MKMNRLELVVVAIVVLSIGDPVHAQYPKISSEVGAESARLNKQMQRHSDEAWERALPAIVMIHSEAIPSAIS